MTVDSQRDPAGSRPPSRPKRLLLVICGLILGVVASELAVRSLPPEQLGFSYESGRFLSPREFEKDPARNTLGFHDAEPGERRADVQRILLLGDSYVAAHSVSVEEIVGQRLQHHLDLNSKGRHEVLSIGTPGWGQREELRELRRLGPRLRPDVVVMLFLSFNDVRNNSPELQALALEQLDGMARFRPGWSNFTREEAVWLLLEGSALNRLLSHRLTLAGAARRSGEVPIDYMVYATESDEPWRRAWQETESLLSEMREECERLEARFAVVCASTPHGVQGAAEGLEALLSAYPSMKGRSWDLEGPDRRIAQWCESAGVPLLRLEPVFRRIQEQEQRLLHWRFNGHWNVDGNDVAGAHIASFLLELE